MTQIYLKYAMYYNMNYNVATLYTAVNGTPLHDWRQYADTGMDLTTVKKLFFQHVYKKRRAIRLALITGPYMADSEKPMIIIDVDKPPVEEENKMSLMKSFAKDGFQVVKTPRGFHLHAFLPKNEKLPYIIGLLNTTGEKKEHIGEGGCLYPHPWSTVPSMRALQDNKWTRYAFVHPSLDKPVASYDKFIKYREILDPSTMSLQDIIDTVESLMPGVKVTMYTPISRGAAKVAVSGAEYGRRHPLFSDLEEFIAYTFELQLPLCVAWVLYHYLYETGDEYHAARISHSSLIEAVGLDVTKKVPHGMRFIISATVALFLAHIIEFITLDEIYNVLQYAIEDWPEDDGAPLDRKLSYLFLQNEEGYVYPRYNGLGVLSPVTVFPKCQECFYWKLCKGRKPWTAFKRVYRRVFVANMIYHGSE